MPLDDLVANERWGDSPQQVRLAFEMFIEGVYIERGKQLKQTPDAATSDVVTVMLQEPDFPRLPSSSWAWFKQANLQRNGSDTRGPRTTLEEVADELRQVTAEEDEASRRGLWKSAVNMPRSNNAGLTEEADSFALAMTVVYLIGHTIRARVQSAEAKANRVRAAAAASAGAGYSSAGCMGPAGSFRGVSLFLPFSFPQFLSLVLSRSLCSFLAVYLSLSLSRLPSLVFSFSFVRAVCLCVCVSMSFFLSVSLAPSLFTSLARTFSCSFCISITGTFCFFLSLSFIPFLSCACFLSEHIYSAKYTYTYMYFCGIHYTHTHKHTCYYNIRIRLYLMLSHATTLHK